jgi:hypothetical protein
MMQANFEQPDPSDFGPLGLHVGWDPGGDSAVGAVLLPDDHSGTPKFGLQWWDVSGRKARLVPTPGASSSYGTQLLSPSGRRAAVAAGRTGLAVVDTKTGETRATPPSPSQVVYGWVDEGHLVVEGGGGLVLLAMDGSTQPYATRVGTAALSATRIDITHVTA